jgi:thiamine-phosphate pyrophosphorylase
VPFERIIDVNINRLDESLKFTEDIIRFSLQNKELLSDIRKIRNDFLKIKKALPLDEIVTFRKSMHDLGRKAQFDLHLKKAPDDIITANITRAKEAARIIEETLKTRNIAISSRLKKLRFKIYDLELHMNESLRKKFTPRLYVVIDEKYLFKYRPDEIIKIFKTNNVTMVQLRIETLDDRTFYNYAQKIKKTIGKSHIKFIVNNRIDIAQACRADGVHLGQHDIPIKAARTILGPIFIIGASARTVKDALMAQKQGADYIGVGAVFKTMTKKDAPVCGLSVLQSICENVDVPVVGIGGITDKNYKMVLRAGASGIAVCSYIFEGNLRKNLRSLTGRKSSL